VLRPTGGPQGWLQVRIYRYYQLLIWGKLILFTGRAGRVKQCARRVAAGCLSTGRV